MNPLDSPYDEPGSDLFICLFKEEIPQAQQQPVCFYFQLQKSDSILLQFYQKKISAKKRQSAMIYYDYDHTVL
ncbi:MAG: hypothetical protein HYZ14_17660 [Bacteroidetes bacterium]|nr:hypothetical protein [Bacteroidota bacterium]